LESKLKKIAFKLLLLPVIFIACGESVLDLGDNTYEPKIVIDGYIMPNQRVKNIRISRNFPLNKNIDIMDFPLSDADVFVTDLQSNISYPLRFNIGQLGFEYRGKELQISYGNSYQLSVTANIDGKKLQATSSTTVPSNGFAIDKETSSLTPMTYREKDPSGNIKNFSVTFEHSSSTDFYALSIIALEASPNNFIDDAPGHIEKDDLDDDLINILKYEAQWAQTSFDPNGKTKIEILWFSTWFYGEYRAILYAGDNNFKQYFLTHNDVQDIDGNLYEPNFFINGDGIGVFGSAIADTVYFTVLRE
jgi:hypothetical protein